MGATGLRNVDDLVKEALLNRTGDGALAKALLARAPSKPDRGSVITLQQQLSRVAMMLATQQTPVVGGHIAKASGSVPGTVRSLQRAVGD
jgi:hypothetical protein